MVTSKNVGMLEPMNLSPMVTLRMFAIKIGNWISNLNSSNDCQLLVANRILLGGLGILLRVGV